MSPEAVLVAGSTAPGEAPPAPGAAALRGPATGTCPASGQTVGDADRECQICDTEAAALCRVVPLAPGLEAAWEDYVRGHPQGTLFHTLGWRNAVAAAFPHPAFYQVALRRGAVVGVLPLFLVRSWVAGRLLVSVPYGVGGGIIADDTVAARALADAARELAGEHRCCAIDLRSERAEVADWPIVNRYVGFRRMLPPTAAEVASWLPRKARAAARNGRDKYGLTIAYGDEHMDTVWRLYTQNMRRLGSLAYPPSFFRALLRHTPEAHWVSLVFWRDRPVAGLVTFLFRDRVMPYFVGTSAAARRCSAANFLYFSTMERAVTRGYREFDFGRSRRDNAGSFDFKRFHGFEPTPLEYQQYSPCGAAPPRLSPDDLRYRAIRRIWSHLPLPATQLMGSLLSRHVPG
ncbi:MAG: FemAB family PEP-CTERM system-associated protein [Planctomycetes bacterium]|nr:FemAB family PEP-CTERM system-associated protein [Planctomycetota bacterium]